MDTAKPYVIKTLGGSLIITLPLDLIHANNLRPGDYLVLDLAKFKILRAEDFALLGRKPELEVA
jgi:hypothetical protein